MELNWSTFHPCTTRELFRINSEDARNMKLSLSSYLEFLVKFIFVFVS